MAPTPLAVTGDPEADRLLDSDAFALLLGMLLDQQISMEKAFTSPFVLRQRLDGHLDAAAILDAGPEALNAAFAAMPALHRFPGSMGGRAYALCQHLVEHYDGDASRVWSDISDARELYRRLRELPGFGDEKTKIFIALLAKRKGITPSGWETVAAPFSDTTPRSVADIDGPESLQQVREWKKAQRAKGKSKQE